MREVDSTQRPLSRDLAVVLAAAITARLAFLIAMPAAAHSVDAAHWEEVFRLLETGVNPYEATTYLNWPPVWVQFIYLIGKTAAGLDVPFLRVLQGFLIGVESVVIGVTLKLLRTLTPGADARRIVLWGLALNPVAILLTCQHGNFDVIVALWVVLFAASLVRFHRSGATDDWLAACLFLGLGIVTKTVPFVLTPLLAYRWRSVPARSRWLGAGLALGPVLLGVSVIYVLAPEGVTANVLRYRSLGGWFGVSGLLGMAGLRWLAAVHGTVFNLLLVAAMATVGVTVAKRAVVREQELVLGAALLLLMIPTLGPGFGPQYLQWFMPLLVALYPAFDARWCAVLVGGAVVAALTYTIEYALFPSHGQFLVRLMADRQSVFELSRAVSGQSGQTLIRLPLFAALLALSWVGVGLVRGSAAKDAAP